MAAVNVILFIAGFFLLHVQNYAFQMSCCYKNIIDVCLQS